MEEISIVPTFDERIDEIFALDTFKLESAKKLVHDLLFDYDERHQLHAGVAVKTEPPARLGELFDKIRECAPNTTVTYLNAEHSLFDTAFQCNVDDATLIPLISQDPKERKHQLQMTLGVLYRRGTRMVKEHSNARIKTQQVLINGIKDKVFLSNILRDFVLRPCGIGQDPAPNMVQSVQLLVEAGADINITAFDPSYLDKDDSKCQGETLLMMMMPYSHWQSIIYLMVQELERMLSPELKTAFTQAMFNRPFQVFGAKDQRRLQHQLENPYRETQESIRTKEQLVVYANRQRVLFELIELQRKDVLSEAQLQVMHHFGQNLLDNHMVNTVDLSTLLMLQYQRQAEHRFSEGSFKKLLEKSQAASHASILREINARILATVYMREAKVRERYLCYAKRSLLLFFLGLPILVAAVFVGLFLYHKYVIATVRAHDMSFDAFCQQLTARGGSIDALETQDYNIQTLADVRLPVKKVDEHTYDVNETVVFHPSLADRRPNLPRPLPQLSRLFSGVSHIQDERYALRDDVRVYRVHTSSLR